MHKSGHFGAAALLAAPGMFLLGVAGVPVLGALFAFLCVAVATLPDRFESVLSLRHRGVGHTLVFVATVALCLSSAAYFVDGDIPLTTPSPLSTATTVGGGVTIGLLSHLATDIITVGGGFRVRPFWPVSRKSYQVGWVKSDTRWNYVLFVVGFIALALSARLLF